jgi:hypothetical protein
MRFLVIYMHKIRPLSEALVTPTDLTDFQPKQCTSTPGISESPTLKADLKCLNRS